jgi:hypothetical protein
LPAPSAREQAWRCLVATRPRAGATSGPGPTKVGNGRRQAWPPSTPDWPGPIWTLGEESRLPWLRPTLPKENALVDVRIGVTHTPKEIEVELADGTSPDAVVQQIEQALSGHSVLWLTDRRGRRVGIPAATVAYIELNTASEDRRVGFGAAVR